MLQEAIDSLFDNSRKSNADKSRRWPCVESLSDVLKASRAASVKICLVKRVDYSGRSVIVVGLN